MTTTRAALTTAAEAIGHAHVADLDACLDLINTVELTDGIPADSLATTEDALAFFGTRSIAHEDALLAQAHGDGDAEGWLARVHATRAALREVWDAVEGRTPAGDAVGVLNDVLAHAPHVELRAGIAGVVVGHRHEADATAEALARLVEPLVAAIAAGETARFRVCANDGCRWVFEDTSRGGRRRWCDMSSCGNRAKVRRFRSKRRSAGAQGDADVEAAGGAGN
jgi:predicted RNA-binding Zn ribbon-like protein